jgi:hypothetical protein
MQTEKDAEIVGWVGRVGAAGAEHVMERFAMGRSWAYARLASLVSATLGLRFSHIEPSTTHKNKS